MSSITTIMMSAGMFARRSRSGWLDELDGIRDEALDDASGEVDVAMFDAEPTAPVEADDTSPLTVLEEPLPPAIGFEPVAPPERALVEPTYTPQTLGGGYFLAEPPVAAPPVAEVSPTAPVRPSPPAPPVSASLFGSDVQAVAAVTASLRPAPHPTRPQEMWHPPVPPAGLPPEPLVQAAEEHLDPAELLSPESAVDIDTGEAAAVDVEVEALSSTPRFRFARLRAVLPLGEHDGSAGSERGDGPEIDPGPSLLEQLVAPYGYQDQVDEPVDEPLDEDPEPVDEESEPVSPEPDAAVVERALIDGPVGRRAQRDRGPRLRDRALRLRRNRTVAPVAEDQELDQDPDQNEEPAEEARGEVAIAIDTDGSVEFPGGHVRLPEDARTQVGGEGGRVALHMTDGWCWISLDDDGGAQPVVVSMPSGCLTLPPGATALAVVEADGAGFVVVTSGEADLVHPGGRLRLRRGAMALVPVGAEPQVDMASDHELQADPLVRLNQERDRQR